MGSEETERMGSVVPAMVSVEPAAGTSPVGAQQDAESVLSTSPSIGEPTQIVEDSGGSVSPDLTSKWASIEGLLAETQPARLNQASMLLAEVRDIALQSMDCETLKRILQTQQKIDDLRHEREYAPDQQ